MRLTATLLKRKMPNGFIWTGKHRLGHHVFAQNIERFVKRLEIEEKNLLYLRNPYLTVEQEKGHCKALEKQQKWMDNVRLYQASKKLMKSTTFEDRFKYLCVSDKWED